MLISIPNQIFFKNEHDFIAYACSSIMDRTRLTQREIKKRVTGYNSYQPFLNRHQNLNKVVKNYTSIDETIILDKRLNHSDKFVYFVLKFLSLSSKKYFSITYLSLYRFGIKFDNRKYKRILQKLKNLNFINLDKQCSVLNVKILDVECKIIIPKKKNLTKKKNNSKLKIGGEDMSIFKKDYLGDNYEDVKKIFRKHIIDIQGTFLGINGITEVLTDIGIDLFKKNIPETIINNIDEWLDVDELEKYFIPQFKGVAKTDKAKRYKQNLLDSSLWFSKNAEMKIEFGYGTMEFKQPNTKQQLTKRDTYTKKPNTKQSSNQYLQDENGCLTDEGEKWLEETTFLGKSGKPNSEAVDYAKQQQAYWRSLFEGTEIA